MNGWLGIIARPGELPLVLRLSAERAEAEGELVRTLAHQNRNRVGALRAQGHLYQFVDGVQWLRLDLD
jgi:hypothetical protein